MILRLINQKTIKNLKLIQMEFVGDGENTIRTADECRKIKLMNEIVHETIVTMRTVDRSSETFCTFMRTDILIRSDADRNEISKIDYADVNDHYYLFPVNQIDLGLIFV